MPKHSRKQNRDYGKRRSANVRIPESASSAVERICTSLGSREDFASVYLHKEYLSKLCLPRADLAQLRKSAAISKWLSMEEKNRCTNAYLRGMDRGFNILPRVSFYRFLEFAQRLSSQILGPLTDEVIVGEFSGGASTSRRRSSSSAAEKFTGVADVTEGAIQYVDLIHRLCPLLRRRGVFYDLNVVEGAVLFTVPKKTDIDRCACKEPDINMYLQKGVGNHIRRRLRKFGITLNDQSVNRRLALRGSIDSSIATLDLSSASDTITTSCVRALLPDDWFLYLNDIRSQSVEVDGTLVRTEMFSSMGNGFTFELESLLFYVLMRTVSYFEGIRGVVSVYGDDLIIPSGMFDSAHFVLEQFGFALNTDKSFHTGPFRESCGGHYHSGVDVTPFYLKRPATHLTDVIRVANQLRRWALADMGRQYENPELFQLWKSLKDLVPESLWGGRDYSVDTQLVSPEPRRKRLVRRNIEKEVPVLGRYVDWHNTHWNRSVDPVGSGFEPVRTDNFCRLRAAPQGAPYVSDYFHEELV